MTPAATPTQLKSAYRTLARKYHPDSGTDASSDVLFNEVTEAYHVLSDKEQRDKYDRRHGFDAWQPQEEEPAAAENANSSDSQSRRDPNNHSSGPEGDKTVADDSQDTFYHGGSRVHAKQNINTEDIESAGYAGPSGNRFSHAPRSGSFLDKMRDLFGTEESQPTAERTAYASKSFRPPPRKDSPPNKARKSVQDALKGEREFTFTISASESLAPSYRQIAVKDGASPRTIRVKIPAGVCDGASLKVQIGDGEHVRVHVRVHDDDLLSREGYDVILKLPITIGESVNGGELEVPTPLGPVTVKLPALSKDRKRLRLKGRGAPKPGSSGARGDLFVKPYVVGPDITNEVVKQAAAAIDEHYVGDVRSGLPKKL